MQTLHTKNYGSVSFERTWIAGDVHIGKMVGGGYAYLSGLPVKSKKELKAVIPAGPFLEEALAWFDKKDEPQSVITKKVVIFQDGGYAFDDGSQITSLQELVNFMPAGSALDAAIEWFSKEKKKRESVKEAAATKAGQAAAKVKAMPKMPEKPETEGVEVTV